MALMIFKYGLPIMLGYILFVGISGRFLPWKRPKALSLRPYWFLGLWTGITVAAALCIGLHMAYQMDMDSARTLVKPAGLAALAIMIPGLLGFLLYNRRVKTANSALADNHDQPAALEDMRAEQDDEDDATVIIWENADANIDTDDISIPDFDPDDTLAHPIPELDTHESATTETAILDTHESATAETEILDTHESETAEAEILDTHESETADATTIATYKWDSSELATLDTHNAESARDTAAIDTLKAELNTLRESLDSEQQFRTELETHLRITRKGLAALESEARDYEVDKANALIVLEEKLEQQVKAAASADARAEREASRCTDLETTVVNLKQEFLRAKNESRRSTEARARALATANKATVFARRAMGVRANLERKIRETDAALKNRQETISSLVKALEKEKSRTQEDVATMAKQLVLHEKQLQARRSLEEVSRSVDNKLTTRLVKKVAKARPVARN